ncbi:hypothetical protein [Streptomyces sp. NPDC017260]|uniref:hypothetical protein n=1 Tax=unclassified Streptomyces TaxID=2593676 RepID=UPI0037AD34DF
MAGTQQKLQWYEVGASVNGGFGKESDFPALFQIKRSDRDGGLRVHTTLPGHFRVGAFGFGVDSIEQGQAYAEEVLKDFYRALKKQMEPKKAPARASSLSKGKGAERG